MHIKHRLPTAIFAGVLVGFFAGRMLSFPGCTPREKHNHMESTGIESLYACPMMCVPPKNTPGNCPVCGMKLVPQAMAADDNAYEGDASLELSPRARAMAEIEVAPVERRAIQTEIRMAGKVSFDETRTATIASRVAGRLDRLYADHTGIAVQEGDRLVRIYSPDLLAAQEELIQALSVADAFTTSAAREKLRLWGLTGEQIAEIEQTRQASDHVTVFAPISGVVLERNADEGSYVREGTPIYTIADLSQLWVQLDAYEMDLAFIRNGQEVQIRTESHPGHALEGIVSFVSPVLNEKTRSVKVRVNVPNPDGLLKPGMFVRAVVHATAGAGGSSELPLIIPATSPLITGKRAVVYVEKPGNPGTYEGRTIILGPRAGDHYIVADGLIEGEKVVVNGAFKIDSALQIRAKPGMLKPPEPGELDESSNLDAAQAVHDRPVAGQQKLCPVMGNPIDRDVYVDYEGKRIYFCCRGCDARFMDEPEKYLALMHEEGIEPDTSPEAGLEQEEDHDR